MERNDDVMVSSEGTATSKIGASIAIFNDRG